MTSPDENPFPKMDVLPKPIDRVLELVKFVFRMPHQLASHGDHFVHDPLASPIEPVTSWPVESDGIDAPNQMVIPDHEL